MGIGFRELLIILAIIIIVFGPARLAGVGQSLGQAIRAFRTEVRQSEEITNAPNEQQL